MRPVLFLTLILATATSCTNPIPSEPPYIRGTITAVTDRGLHVVAPGGETDCGRRADVGVRGASVRWRSGGVATASYLVVGTEVSVWIDGTILESCPPIVGGEIVVIEDQSGDGQ